LLKGSGRVRLRIRPSMHFLPHEAPVSEPLDQPYRVLGIQNRFEVCCPESNLPPLRMITFGPEAAFVQDGGRFRKIFYRVEKARGYDSIGTLYSPGYFRVNLT